MSLFLKFVIIAIISFLCMDIVMVIILMIKRLKKDELSKELKKEDAMLGLLSGFNLKKNRVNIEQYYHLKQAIELDFNKKKDIENHLNLPKLEKKYTRGLKSFWEVKRSRSAVLLGLIGTETARQTLEQALENEKSFPVKIYIANSLADLKNMESIPVLVSSLMNSHRWYREKVNMLISDYGEAFHAYLPKIIHSDRVEIIELIVDFSSLFFSLELKEYLISLVDRREEVKCLFNSIYKIQDPTSQNPPIIIKAAGILANFYPTVLDNPQYIHSQDLELKNIALKGLVNIGTKETVEKLLFYLSDMDLVRSAIYSISKIIERKPEYIKMIVERFQKENDLLIRQRLADILTGRIEYFIMKLAKQDNAMATDIIKQILLLGRTSEVIDFLNKNKNIDLENELISIIKEVTEESPALKSSVSNYLNQRIAKKCGFEHNEETEKTNEKIKDKKLAKKLWLMLIFSVMIFPIIYVLRRFDLLLMVAPFEQLKIYVVDFNYYIAFYSMAINSIYIVLLLLSFIHVRKQLTRFKVKSVSLLFKKRMLPSVSILAPAFNEEKTIIESVNSLLNLKYPDYELIVINDGSKDKTMETLVKYFDLNRVDHVLHYKLKTKAVRGIYKNRSLPKLILVDKENGGKADALNAGINMSTKEYFCGIDADSLLDNDALLKLASLTLDEGIETPAMGGNVYPINGCTVERGQIKDIRIPKNKLGRFQTIEYIRAFMAGRLGWASINSLLIISGAFGLFRKERVISVGGYLTSSGEYAKNTVGEDMELVVRISRLMREKGYRYKIRYSFNANCWTEVPEDFKSLKMQRFRWHKGLIDVLMYHKKMLFNPGYGRTGLLAMPYFFIFEMLGPLIEIQGYLMVVLAFILGLLNKEIALLLFFATIGMGVFISIASLLISEKDKEHYKMKDLLILVGYSIIENFGPRQFFSFLRVAAYFSMLAKESEWGSIERKGFGSTNISVREEEAG